MLALLARCASVILFTVACASAVHAAEPDKFIQQHCVKCHGPEKQEADLRLDKIAAPNASQESSKLWATILERVETGDMPPPKEPRPDADATGKLVKWISSELARNTPRLPALRRLNRFEYENTVHDLLGIDADLAELLPEDSSVQGFDNVAGGLGLSSILMERYLEAGDAAFDATIRRIKPLPPDTRRAVLMENKENIASVKEKKGGVIEAGGAFVDFSSGWPPARIDEAHPIEDGVYKCRIAVFPHNAGKRTLMVGVFAGPLFGPGKRTFMGMYDVTGTAEEPRIIEFTVKMKEAETLHILPWIYPDYVSWRDKEEPAPGVAVAWAETQGPLDQAFPATSQVKLFGDAKTLTIKDGSPIWMRHRKGVKLAIVDSTEPQADAERIIREFVPRAFRRPVDGALTQQFVDLTLARLDSGSTFEQAVRAGVTAVLCSPHFLLINQQPKVDDYEIASRLSYFLWSSMPDEELLKLAAEGKLRDSAVRHAQVDRMLKDPKRERFVENFTGQWLDLREIEFTTPDKKLYPEYDEILLYSMLGETRGFFRHLLDNDLSITNFIDSDFAILNQRLAEHYGIPDVQGHEEFRVVKLPEDSIRGGILAQAAVLKVTANGTSTSPVVRGAWVLRNLLGQPPQPPPPGVPAVEPDIRGAATIREQLQKHRENESCNRCHTRIDPAGFALEEFDVIGGQRDFYRSISDKGPKVSKYNYRRGPDVEKGDKLPDGRPFADFVAFRQLLLDRPEPVAHAIAEKLLVYGCGRPVTPADHEVVADVVSTAKKNNLGLRSMIHAVVDSELFLQP